MLEKCGRAVIDFREEREFWSDDDTVDTQNSLAAASQGKAPRQRGEARRGEARRGFVIGHWHLTNHLITARYRCGCDAFALPDRTSSVAVAVAGCGRGCSGSSVAGCGRIRRPGARRQREKGASGREASTVQLVQRVQRAQSRRSLSLKESAWDCEELEMSDE